MALGVQHSCILSTPGSKRAHALAPPVLAAPFTSLRPRPQTAYISKAGHVTVPTAAQKLQGPAARCIAAKAALSDSEQHTPFPFHDADYHKVMFVPPPYGPMKLYEDSKGGTFNGVLVFKREADLLSSDDLTIMEVFVAGDTAFNTWSQLTHHTTDRPMVHELMWTLLERARGGEPGTWSLLRVGIVELRDNVYIGRLWFGDAETGEVMWDCDCRPSDGCFLSIKAKCPFFVHRRVWDISSLPIRNSSVYKLVASTTHHSSSAASSFPSSAATAHGNGNGNGNSGLFASHMTSGAGQGQGAGGERGMSPHATSMSDLVLIRPDDPDAIKLIKRELAVAVKEEDYSSAIRLRDHAWMRMYKEVHGARLAGRYDEAHRIEMELHRQIMIVSETHSNH